MLRESSTVIVRRAYDQGGEHSIQFGDNSVTATVFGAIKPSPVAISPAPVSGLLFSMERREIDTLLAVVAVILATVALPPPAAVPVLTFVVGLFVGWRGHGSRG
jgi:hypothetical protein